MLKLLQVGIDPGVALYALDIEGELWMAPLKDGKPEAWIHVQPPDAYPHPKTRLLADVLAVPTARTAEAGPEGTET